MSHIPLPMFSHVSVSYVANKYIIISQVPTDFEEYATFLKVWHHITKRQFWKLPLCDVTNVAMTTLDLKFQYKWKHR